MTSLVVAKVLSMVSLLVCSLVASFAPYKVAAVLTRWDEEQCEKEKIKHEKTKSGAGNTSNASAATVPKSERIISMMICFSGGVLLAVAIVHMLPEVRRDIEKAMREGTIVDTPLAVPEIVFCAGFLVVYLVERFVRYLVTVKHDGELGKLTAAIQPSVLTAEQSAAVFDSKVGLPF
jgi:zinc transporter 1/2/3